MVLGKTWMKGAIAAAAVASVLVGCGAEHATKPRKGGGSSSGQAPGAWMGGPGMPGQTGGQLPGQGGPAGADDPQARALITKTIGTVTAMPAFQLEMHWFQKKGSKLSKGVYDILGKAPRSIRIDIREGTGKGTKVLYTGGPKAKVRPDGLLGAITVDLSVNDDRLLSVRGYNIPQTDLKGLMEQLGDANHRARLVAQQPDRATIEVAGGKLLGGCVRMVAEVDPNTGLPLVIDQFDAREMVFHMEIRNFKQRKSVSLDI